MFNNFELTVGLRYLKSKKAESFISFISLFSLLGVCLGVAALIVVMAVMNGFHTEITNKMIGFNGDINVTSQNHAIYDFDYIAKKIGNIKEVKHVYPVIDEQVLVSNQSESSGAMVKGIRYLDLFARPLISSNISAGDMAKFKQEGYIIIGEDLARNLSVTSGDFVTILSKTTTPTILGSIPRLKSYEIAAIFNSGMYQFDSSTIFMNLEDAQLFFKMPGAVNLIEVSLMDPFESKKVMQKILPFLPNTLLVNDWQNINASFFAVLKTERITMFVILTLIIIVASFNIISSLIMLVREKNHDIAIMRTMGASSASVMKIFFIIGISIGFVGTALGVLLGLVIALNIDHIRIFLENITNSVIFDPIIYYLSALPSKVEYTDVTKIALMSLTLSIIASLYPAYRATKVNPAEALRYE